MFVSFWFTSVSCMWTGIGNGWQPEVVLSFSCLFIICSKIILKKIKFRIEFIKKYKYKQVLRATLTVSFILNEV